MEEGENLVRRIEALREELVALDAYMDVSSSGDLVELCLKWRAVIHERLSILEMENHLQEEEAEHQENEINRIIRESQRDYDD